MFVGDNPRADIEGARRAGMHPIWFQRHLHWPGELDAESRTIKAWSELRTLVVVREGSVYLA